MTYQEALETLCTGGRQHPDRDMARQTITDAVWELASEAGEGKGEMYDWIAEGDWAPANLSQPGAWSAEALAAEWNAYQRAARDL